MRKSVVRSDSAGVMWAWTRMCVVYTAQTARLFNLTPSFPTTVWAQNWHLDNVIAQMEVP